MWGLDAVSAADFAEFFGRAFIFAIGGYIGGFWLLSMRRLTDAL